MSEAETPFVLTYCTVGAVLYVLAIYKARAWLNERIPSLLLMAGSALASGTGFLAAAPTVYRWLGETSNIPNLATLIVYVSITLSCAFFLVLVQLWSPPTSPTGATSPVSQADTRWALRRVIPPYAAAVTVMTILFLCADLPAHETPLTFDTTFADRPVVLAFLLTYQTAYGWALWSMAHVCLQRSRDVHDPVLRNSLRRMTVGSVLVASYGLCKIIAIVGAALGSTNFEPLSTSVGPALASFGGLIMATGWAYAALRTRRQRRRDFHALETLWTTATRADPGVILPSPPRGQAWEFHVLRRTHEIRDGQLALRGWTSQHTVDRARRLADQHGLDPTERDAFAAAAALRDALRALRTKRAPAQPCQIPPGISLTLSRGELSRS
ncbi:MAB_1171c family putative transporter [Streptomyces hygroscopicus]|uniref:MAB_1171c family putative transporter n=1 Tax=Streptomyces hygroscopicus TaxID=1912 RepID=UPI0036A9F956